VGTKNVPTHGCWKFGLSWKFCDKIGILTGAPHAWIFGKVWLHFLFFEHPIENAAIISSNPGVATPSCAWKTVRSSP
jgi:hypothetical protein